MKQPHHYRAKSDRILGMGEPHTWQELLAVQQAVVIEANLKAAAAEEGKQKTLRHYAPVKNSGSRCVIL